MATNLQIDDTPIQKAATASMKEFRQGDGTL